ncbi:MAG: O-antigen ligase family protein [Candidatus Eremiobacterota bacterium]
MAILLFFLVSSLSVNLGYTKIEPHEIMLLLLTAVYIVKAFKNKDFTFNKAGFELPLMCFIIASAISSLASVNIFASVKEVLKLTEYFLIYILSVNILSGKPSGTRQLFLAMVYISIMVCIYGFIIDSIHINRNTARATFVHYNIYGGYINLFLPFSIAFIFFKKNFPVKDRLFWIVTAIIMMAGLALSLSRGAWVAFFSVLVFYVILKGNKKIYFIALILLLLSTILLPLLAPNFIFVRFVSMFNYDSDIAILHRFNLWKSCFHMFISSPFIGTGTGNFDWVYPAYAIKGLSHSLVANHANNMYINILAETGLLGFLTFSWFFIVLWKKAFNFYGSGVNPPFATGFLGVLLAISIHGLFDYILYHPSMALNFMVIMAIFATEINKVNSE